MDEQYTTPSTTPKCADFLSKLSDEDKQSLLELGSLRKFSKDELLFSAGSVNDDVYILRRGRIKIYELSKEGKEFILWFCFPGEVFGLAEAMQVSKTGLREVNAQSCTPIEVIMIKQMDFQNFLLHRPKVSMFVIDLLSYRLRELGDVLINLASDDVASRVLKLLARLAMRYGKPLGNNLYIDIGLTHQEMADMIGTSRQTVTTVLGELKRKNIVRTEQRTIFIQDLNWLERIIGKRVIIKLFSCPLINQDRDCEINSSLTLNRNLDAIV